MMRERAIYWDASAILSALLRDEHSRNAGLAARRAGLHLMTSLAWCEVNAVLSRMERERSLAKALAQTARDALAGGPWRRANVVPEWKIVSSLSRKWALRGADLWHLAAARALQTDLPELRLLSFDARLAAAARGEGLA